jgi:hypothetical protein
MFAAGAARRAQFRMLVGCTCILLTTEQVVCYQHYLLYVPDVIRLHSRRPVIKLICCLWHLPTSTRISMADRVLHARLPTGTRLPSLTELSMPISQLIHDGHG